MLISTNILYMFEMNLNANPRWGKEEWRIIKNLHFNFTYKQILLASSCLYWVSICQTNRGRHASCFVRFYWCISEGVQLTSTLQHRSIDSGNFHTHSFLQIIQCAALMRMHTCSKGSPQKIISRGKIRRPKSVSKLKNWFYLTYEVRRPLFKVRWFQLSPNDQFVWVNTGTVVYGAIGSSGSRSQYRSSCKICLTDWLPMPSSVNASKQSSSDCIKACLMNSSFLGSVLPVAAHWSSLY